MTDATDVRVQSGGKLSARRAVALAFLALAGCVLLAGMAWWWGLNVNPTVAVPTPALPSPNAFEAYVDATAALVEAEAVGNALGQTWKTAPAGKRYSPAEKADLVRQNGPALAKLRAALPLPYHEPPARSFSHLFPHYAGYRALARLLALESQVKAARGDWSGSLDGNLDTVRMGTEIAHGSPLIGALVAYAVQAIGRREAWAAVKHLDAATARRAARRLEAIQARRVPFADTVQEEKWLAQAGLMELFRQPNWRRELTSGLADATQPADFGAAVASWTASKTEMLAVYTAYMDGMVAAARHPYPATTHLPAVPEHPVIGQIAPAFDGSWFLDVKEDTLNRLLLVSLALRAYRVEHGRYPRTLAELAPSYLRQAPGDPFAAGKPLGYRRKGDGYLLYSVGPDGVDNGGRPIIATATRGSFQQGDTGDVVAFVNIR